MDGELPRADRADVEVHLRECPDCARHLEELAALDDHARALPVEAPEGYFESFPGRVRSRLEAQAEAAPTHWRPPVWTWAAAAVLLLAVLTPLTYRRTRLPASAPRSENEIEQRAAPEQQPAPTMASATPSPQPYGELDAEGADRLRALGYTAGDAKAPGSSDGRQAAPAKPQGGAASRAAPAPAAAPPPVPPPATAAATPTSQAPGYAQAPPPLAEDEARAPRENAAEAPEEYAAKKERTAEEKIEVQAQTETTTGARGTLNGEIGSGRKDEPARPESRLGDLAVRKQASAYSRRFETLAALPAPRTAAEARARWEAWRAVARANPKAREADEARVRALEAGALAYRLSRDPKDLAAVREEAAAYLKRADAAQAERVRALLADLSPSP
jgi:hypothetical protein